MEGKHYNNERKKQTMSTAPVKDRKRVKSTRKKRNRNKKILLLNLLQLVFLGLMIFSGIKICKWYVDNKKSNNQLNDISNCIKFENDEYQVDFSELSQKNPDTVGWIKVENTLIEYPVVQCAKDNEFYLHHSFDKTYNSAGWIFMDYRNNSNSVIDKNTIIYGHNRRNDSMFGTLKNILTPEWYNNEENKYVTYINKNEKCKYEVFSVYQVQNEDYYIQTDFKNDDEFQKFINTIKSRSIKDFGVEVEVNDNILTLSSCANDNKYRIVLHAKKINI